MHVVGVYIAVNLIVYHKYKEKHSVNTSILKATHSPSPLQHCYIK